MRAFVQFCTFIPVNCALFAIQLHINCYIVIHHFLEFIFAFLFSPNWPQFVHFLCLKNSYHVLSKWQIASSAAIKTTTLYGKNAARWKTYKSIKSLSLLLCHGTLKYRSNHNNQFEHTLFTCSVYFFDLSLIARSLFFFFTSSEIIFRESSRNEWHHFDTQTWKKWFNACAIPELKETLKRNGEAKNRIDTHTSHVDIHIDDGKANEQIKHEIKL